jgi:hypothetical protein
MPPYPKKSDISILGLRPARNELKGVKRKLVQPGRGNSVAEKQLAPDAQVTEVKNIRRVWKEEKEEREGIQSAEGVLMKSRCQKAQRLKRRLGDAQLVCGSPVGGECVGITARDL